MVAFDPFVSINPVVASIEQRRGRVEQVRENAARQAQSFAQITTTGLGEVRHSAVVPFDCTFIEPPSISIGLSMDGDQLVSGDFPIVTAGVWRWQQDRREFYVGAYVFFNVVLGNAAYVLTHHFTFSGIAIKDLPDYLLEV